MKRRTFLIGSLAIAGGLLVGYRTYSASFQRRAKKLVEGRDETLLGGWVKISTDNTVTIYIPHLEMGQGSHTALAALLADELDADWSKVKPVHAPADGAFANRFLIEGLASTIVNFPKFLNSTVDEVTALASRIANLQQTAGSFAIRTTGLYGMRVVGAAAREVLIKTAAHKWNISKAQLITQDGFVIDKASGRKISYGELAPAAGEYSISSRPKLKEPKSFTLIGRPVPRLDIPEKVDGKFKYGIDLDFPDMRYVAMKAAPVHGGELVSIDEAAAMNVSGVEHVLKLKTSVAIVAKSFWQAKKALEVVKAKYSDGNNGSVSSDDIKRKQSDVLKNGDRTEKLSVGDVSAALKSKTFSKLVEAEYHVPFLHHAAIEPINITAKFEDNHLTIWGGSQNPLSAKSNVVRLSGLSSDKVTFIPQYAGGAFGRRGTVMAIDLYLEPAIEAAKKLSPRPVKLIWSREEDFAQGCFRPKLATICKASLNENGLPETWQQVFIEGRPIPLEEWPIPYMIPNQFMSSVEGNAHIRTGSWRSVNYSQHGFWKESFIDECAHAADADPLDYRRRLVPENSRHRKVLDVIEEKSNWKTSPPDGVGRGIAIVDSYGTVVAHVVEITMQENEISPKILRVTSVVDCGMVVNPEIARQQIEGGVLMGLGSALGEEITIKDGKVVQQNYPDYSIMTLANTPAEISVHFVNSAAHWGGLGEPGLPPAAPALGNAIFALTGKRVRSTPFARYLSAEKI